jgi:hypothetical protein
MFHNYPRPATRDPLWTYRGPDLEPEKPVRPRQFLHFSGHLPREKAPQDVLVQYVRDEQRRPVGVLVATSVGVGWSYASRYDTFDRELGRTIALGRVYAGTSGKTQLPYLVAQQLPDFYQRAFDYFFDDRRDLNVPGKNGNLEGIEGVTESHGSFTPAP